MIKDLKKQRLRMRFSDLEIVLFAITVFLYSFDGYIFYISGIVYLLILLFNMLSPNSRTGVAIKKDSSKYVLLYIIVYPILNWFAYNYNALNSIEIRNIFGYFLLLSFLLSKGNNFDRLGYFYKVLIAFGVFEAVCVIVQFIMPAAFLSVYGILFPIRVNTAALKMKEGYLWGFTNQVANTAYYILVAIAIKFSNEEIKKKKDRVLLLVLFVSLLLTGKRGHMLFCLSALILTYFFSDNNKLKLKTWTKLFGVFLACVLVITILYNSKTVIGYRVVETINGIFSGNDVSNSRSIINALTISIILKNWLIGIGWGRYKYEYQAHWKILSGGTWDQTYNAHNIYLQLLAEVGIVGFILFLMLSVMGLYFGIKLLRNCRYFSNWEQFIIKMNFFIQVFFLLYGITGNPLYDYNEYSMYFIAIAVSAQMFRNIKKLG